MGYKIDILKRSFLDSRKWVGDHTIRTIVFSIAALGLTLYITCKLRGNGEAMVLLINAGISLMASVIVFVIIYLEHVFYRSPKHLYQEAQCKIKEQEDQIQIFEENLKPKIKIVHDANAVPFSIDYHKEDGGTLVKVYRAVVRNICDKELVGCKGHLISVSKNGSQLWGNRKTPLDFTPGGRPDSICKTIKRKGTEALDLIFLRIKDNHVIYKHVGTTPHNDPVAPQLNDLFSKSETYLLTLEIEAGDAVETVCIEFFYDDENSTMKIVMPPSPIPDTSTSLFT